MAILPSGYGTLIMGYNGKTVLVIWAYNHKGKNHINQRANHINEWEYNRNIRKYHGDTTWWLGGSDP